MKALIVGYGKSGKSACALLKNLGYTVSIIENDNILTNVDLDRLFCGLSFVVVSPAVLPTSPLIIKAEQKGISVISEVELAYRFLHGELIAVTGTNGKTTTTMLINHLIKNSVACGNIGIPISNFAQKSKEEDVYIAEISSFQLQFIDKFRPKIAILLNITPDHINYHGNFENYCLAKLKIFKNQTKQDYAILNYDDPLVKNLKLPNTNVYYFSTKKAVNGCFIKDDNIYFRDTIKSNQTKIIAKVSDIKLIGQHNLSNSLAAILASLLAGKCPSNLPSLLSSFKTSSHRLEYITDIDGVSFINDSKATNPSSTISAVKSMNRVTTLILGGSDKGLSFDEIFTISHSLVKNYIFYGQTKQILFDTACKYNIKNIFVADSFIDAVEIAYRITNSGECVLFSPACASYDMFSGYEERGKCFCGIVREIKKRENNHNKNLQTIKV